MFHYIGKLANSMSRIYFQTEHTIGDLKGCITTTKAYEIVMTEKGMLFGSLMAEPFEGSKIIINLEKFDQIVLTNEDATIPKMIRQEESGIITPPKGGKIEIVK